MQFKTLTLLTLAAVAAAVAVPGRGGSSGSIEDIAIKKFTEECNNQVKTVICCSKISSGASKGDLTGNLNGADVTCISVLSNVSAGMICCLLFTRREIRANGGIYRKP